jgi:hypothetical protein
VESQFVGYATYHFTIGTFSVALHGNGEGRVTEGVDLTTLASLVDSVATSARAISESSNLTERDKEEMGQKLQDLVRNSMPDEFFQRIERVYGTAIRNEAISGFLKENMEVTKERLIEFQQQLARKSAAALAWGLSLATLGILILAVFIWLGVPHYETSAGSVVMASEIDRVFHFIMRLGLVSVIEVIAFFFLRQYRLTLIDEKYISNEITNTEMRLGAIVSALKMDAKQAVNSMLPELARTERNFVMKKDEASIFHSGVGADMLPAGVMAELLGKALQIKEPPERKE